MATSAATLLRLIQGDKRNPSRVLDLTGDSISFTPTGINPGPGRKSVLYTDPSILRDGQRRIASSRENAQIQLTYRLKSTTSADVARLQRDINRFALDCQLYEERRECGPIWLEYRWPDGLNTSGIPAPVFGQWNHYLRVYDIEIEQWPQTLHQPYLASGLTFGVVATLTVGPYAEGLRQLAAYGQGLLRQTEFGILVGAAETNYFTNPSFGHSTWSNDWTGHADLDVQNEVYITRSYKSAARLGNASTSVYRSFYQFATLTAATYMVSCYVRKLDGTPVTTDDISMLGQNNNRTTTIEDMGDGWYLAWATFTGAASSAIHGCSVGLGASIIVDDFTLVQANYPSPHFNGDSVGCAWSGTAHASSSVATAGKIRCILIDEMENAFTISFWFTPLDDVSSTDYYLLHYYYDANDYLYLRHQPSTDQWTLAYSYDGTTGSDTDTTAISLLTPVHVVITRDATNLKLYLDGTLAITVSTNGEPTLAGSNASLYIGSDNSAANQANGYFDGLRIWRDVFSATEVAVLYAAESPIKSGGGIIGLPPVYWTEDGDGSLESVTGTVSSTDYDSTGVLFGVAGDVAALTEWRMLENGSVGQSIHFGIKPICLDGQYPMQATSLFLDFNGSSPLEVSAVGDEVERATGSVTAKFDAEVDPLQLVRGRYLVIARLATDGDDITIQGAVWLGTTTDGEEITTAERTIADLSYSYNIFVLGDLVIDWPEYVDPPSIKAGIITTPQTPSSTTVDLDFVLLLPYPYAIGEGLDQNDILIARDTHANTLHYVYSGLSENKLLGGPVDLEPNRYNWLWILNGDDDTAWEPGDTGPLSITVYITPRWSLPGGAVA